MSRWESVSVWSAQMFHPGAMARFTSARTIGSRAPAAQWSISCISASPWLELAVNVRTPVAAAPITAAIAECSLSTRRNRAFIFPEAIRSASRSTMCVWGVMG